MMYIDVAQGRVIEVCADCATKTVTEAVALASPCDTILVKKGFYSEGNIRIEKDLTLLGVDNPIMDGGGIAEIFTVQSNFFHIEGFTIQHVGTSYTQDRAGVRMVESQNFTIKNNRLLDAFFAVYLQKSKNGEVIGNHIRGEAKNEAGSGNAIHIWSCENITVAGNYTAGHRDGIYLEFANNSRITGNLSEHNLRYGLHFMFSHDNFYFQNTFRKNGAGVAVMYSKRIDMRQNTFEHNWGQAAYGMLLKDIHDSKIEQNIFRQNTVGIFVETSNRLLYTQNTFSQNGWAVRMSGGCEGNDFKRNNFISNSFDLAVKIASNDSRFDGNYWSDYSGYDLDRNGFGDVPHRPMKLFSYVVSRTPESIVLLRSLFVDILNFSEKVSPIFTPENVVDNAPLMRSAVSD